MVCFRYTSITVNTLHQGDSKLLLLLLLLLLHSTQRQGLKLIPGPSPTAKTRLLSFNMIQSTVLTELLTGQLYIMGLIDSPLCRRCGAEEETSAQVLCECEAMEHSDITIWVPFSWTLGMLAKSNSGGNLEVY